MRRRAFLKTTSLAGAVTAVLPKGLFASGRGPVAAVPGPLPVILLTWDYGKAVPEAAYRTLVAGGSVIDAVENAVKIPEADPKVTSVGYGGYPDREGRVTLDAAIMDGDGNCGSVVFLEHIMHPISVARAVMENTPHVMLAGEGALQFALENGFKRENLLTKEAEAAYKEWLKKSAYKTFSPGNVNHDTIGLLALNERGEMAGACTTSGMAWKIRGRVGDSPIIGAGLFVDGDVGGATATGIGEAVIKIAGGAVIVELMRNGKTPQEACRIALERILHKQPKYRDENSFLVGFIALRKDGEVGGCSYRKGFQYMVSRGGEISVVDAEHLA